MALAVNKVSSEVVINPYHKALCGESFAVPIRSMEIPTANLSATMPVFGVTIFSKTCLSLSILNLIGSEDSEIKFDINKVYNTTNKINFLIKPDNLQYTHIQEKSSNGTLIEIIAPPTLTNSIISINLNNYQVNSSNLITWSLQNSGAFNITILLTDDVNYLETLNASIDIDNNNTFTINYNSQTAEVNVGEYCLRCITIDRGGFNITSEFSTNLDYLGETVTVNYPQGTYTMDFINLNILVNKTPRML